MMPQGEIIIPPDPNLIISQIVPVMEILAMVLVAGFVAMGPIGRSIGDVVRRVFGADRAKGLPPGEMDALHARFDAIQVQLNEIAERQDFQERMLAQTRERGALGSGT